jgi:DNA-binding CsgD family transcriptional regulator
MYWDKVLKEVLNKNNPSFPLTFTHRKDASDGNDNKSGSNKSEKRKRKMKSYLLGDKYPGVALTQREAECMVQFLKGKTVNKTALALQLSPRTVEFYLKNMKRKLNCQTKSELIGKIVETDFMKLVDTV